jgi:hypothetical protein
MKSAKDVVLEYHQNAIAKKVKKHYEIYSPEKYLGKGKNARCAWISASKNL